MPHTILKVEQFDFSHFSRECGNFIFDATSISCNVNKVRVVLNLFCYRAKPNCKVRVCNCNSKLVQLEKWVAPFKKLRPESVSKRIPRMRANGTRMPLNGVQMHQKVSRRFQKFPGVSECIRITVVSAPNWPKIGRSVRSTSVLVIGRLVRSTSTASVLIIPAATTTPTPIIPNRWKIEITKPRQVIRRPALFHVVLVNY